MLKRGDKYENYLTCCMKHIVDQNCPVTVLPPYITSPTSRNYAKRKWLIASITEKLNEIRGVFLKTDATHVWIVDADIEAPPHALNMLLLLDVDVAAGIYPLHSTPDRYVGGPMRSTTRGKKVRFLTKKEVDGRVLGADGMVTGGNGCLLVKRRVFTTVPLPPEKNEYHSSGQFRFRYFPGPRSSALPFFLDCQRVEFSCRIHTGVVCGHLPEFPL